jgi:tetratricopeptide (TPR) repeat protein
VWISLEAADPIGVAQALDDARQACVESGQPTLAWLLAQQEAVVARIHGDLDAADDHAKAGLDLATAAGLQDGFIYYATQTIGQRFADGRTGEFVDLVQEALASNPSVTGSLRGALGVGLVDLGRLDEASALLDEGLTDDFGMVPHSHPWAMILDLVAQAAHRVGRADVAERLLELFEPMPQVMLVTGPTCSVHVETTRGLLATTLGRHDDAEEHFSRASEVLESFAPLPYARNLYEHGRALLELGDPDDGERARRLLTRAATTFERHGLGVRVAQCEELLAKIGD